MPLVQVRPVFSNNLWSSVNLGLRRLQQELMPLVQLGGALPQLLGCISSIIQDRSAAALPLCALLFAATNRCG